MHRLPSRSSLFRFRAASLTLIAAYLFTLAAVAMVVIGIFHDERQDVFIGLGFLGGALVLIILQWLIATRARCPLCQVPPLQRQGCQKSRKARRLFGSYRLRVASGVLFRNAFQCPYCGEPTKLMVRDRSLGGIDSPAPGTDGPGLR